MNQNLHVSTLSIFILFLFSHLTVSASTFTSTQSGNWFDKTTWAENSVPDLDDDVTISDGHTVTLSQKEAYIFYGNLTVKATGELVIDAGDHLDGLIFCGLEFHVYGTLRFTDDKDLSIIGDGLFWGHDNAVIWVTDDWKINGLTNTIVESICVRVDDDFHIDGTSATLCGDGGVSIGGSNIINTFELLNNASIDQVCAETKIYRSYGGSDCSSLIAAGAGNKSPIAEDDIESTSTNTPVAIDVLYIGVNDKDNDAGDQLLIISAGTNYSYNRLTSQGGRVDIYDNGTPEIPGDDYIYYTPAPEFEGEDTFRYVITDTNGGYASAIVTVTVNGVLPVELVSFTGKEAACTVQLSWATASELNNSHFEIEKSIDGYSFKTLGTLSGAGTSSQYHVYDYKDQLPNTGNYYRLVQVDYDGTRTVSDVIYVKSDCIKNDDNIGLVNVFPNPAIGGTVSMRFNADRNEEVLLSVTDLYGKNILRRAVDIEAGMNNFEVDIAELQAGAYVLTLGKQVSRFMVARD